MKAIRIYRRGGPEVMQLEEMAMPTPAAGQVLIKVAAAGVNYADVGQRSGEYPNLVPLPATLGYEVAGTVVGRGPQTNGVPDGARVVALVDGGYAEYAVADSQVVASLPDDVDFAAATAVPIQGQTAYLLLDQAARLRPGERVLVHAAAGGVGTLAVQLAKLMGAGQVFATARTPEEMALVRSLGADVALNIGDGSWVGQVMQMTQGRGLDIVLDAIGGEVGQQNLAALGRFGRMVVFGSLSNQMTGMAAQQLIRLCQSVIGYNTQLQSPENKARASKALLGYMASGQLKVLVNQTFPLADAAEAHRAIEAGRTTGKVVLTVSGSA